jgi:hypothetical protein
MKIAFLIPCKGDHWKKVEQSILIQKTLASFSPEREHRYFFYIGYDHNDTFYGIKQIQKQIKALFPKFVFRFTEFPKDILPGHLTQMWNILYKQAISEENHYIDYFYQCGDDIQFKTKGWVTESIQQLKKQNNIGIVGPKTDHPVLLTQALFSRTHYDIFGYLFPENIFNWGCDDWLNIVYTPNHCCILMHHLCENQGGKPRYITENYNIMALKNRVAQKANLDRQEVTKYILNLPKN